MSSPPTTVPSDVLKKTSLLGASSVAMVWWVRSDPCGLFSAALTLFLLIYAEVVIVVVVLLPWYGWHWHIFTYSLLVVLATISHTRAQFCDPGAIPKSFVPIPPPSEKELALMGPAPSSAPPFSPGIVAQPLGPGGTAVALQPIGASPTDVVPPTIKVCKRCKTVKPPGVHHCSSCARCIIKMDHHCPWVNNCVAMFNQKYFILFLLYTSISCVYTGALLVGRFVACTRNIRGCEIGGAGVATGIICFVEALVFGLFTMIMAFDQFSAIFDNTPAIDAMQNRKGETKPKMQSLIDVFGERPSWRWLLPLNMPAKVRQDFERELAASQDSQRALYRERDLLAKEQSRLASIPQLPATFTQPVQRPMSKGANGFSTSHDDDGAFGEHEQLLARDRDTKDKST